MSVRPFLGDPKYNGLSNEERMRQSERDALLWEQKEAQREANEIARQQLEEERQYRLECELREEAIREAEIEKERRELCNTVGLDYELIKEFNNVDYRELDWFWEQYLKGDKFAIEDIFDNTGTRETYDKINKNIKKLESKQYWSKYFKIDLIITLSFIIIPSLVSTGIGALLQDILSFEILMVLIFGSLFGGIAMFIVTIIREQKKRDKQPKLQDKELEKIKTFLQDYIKAGEIAIDKFKQYKSNNPNVVFDSIFENVIYKDFLSRNQEKTSRVQRIKSEDKLLDEATEKINKGQGKEYNLAMAKILDEYEQDVDRIVDRFRTQSDIVEEQQLKNTKYCPECGNEVEIKEKYCGKCGKKI